MTPPERNENENPSGIPASLQPLEGLPAHSPESTLWSWADLLVLLFFAALSFVAASFAVSLVYFSVRGFGSVQGLPQSGPENSLLSLALQIIMYGLLFGFIYLLVSGYHRQPFWESLKWRRPGKGKTIAYLIGGIFLAIFVQLAPTLLPDKAEFPLQKMFSSTMAAYAVAAFAVFVAPFMEELVFRGVLFAIFEKRINLITAVGVTAVLFAALHIPEYQGAWNHVLLILFVGIIFSVTRGVTGSLVPSVILHFAYNLTLVAGLYFSTQHFRSL